MNFSILLIVGVAILGFHKCNCHPLAIAGLPAPHEGLVRDGASAYSHSEAHASSIAGLPAAQEGLVKEASSAYSHSEAHSVGAKIPILGDIGLSHTLSDAGSMVNKVQGTVGAILPGLLGFF